MACSDRAIAIQQGVYGMASNIQRMLLVTNHHLFRECLANGVTARIPRLKIDTAETVKQGISLCECQSHAVAVFDADPPDPLSPEMSRKFKQRNQTTDLIIVGRRRSEDEVIAFLEAGATDVRIRDSESFDDFCEAIQSTLRGRVHHRPERTLALFSHLQRLSAEVSRIKAIDTLVLTNREMEILRLLDEGQTNKQIAKKLHISLHTVKNHVHRIIEKLPVSNWTLANFHFNPNWTMTC